MLIKDISAKITVYKSTQDVCVNGLECTTMKTCITVFLAGEPVGEVLSERFTFVLITAVFQFLTLCQTLCPAFSDLTQFWVELQISHLSHHALDHIGFTVQPCSCSHTSLDNLQLTAT